MSSASRGGGGGGAGGPRPRTKDTVVTLPVLARSLRLTSETKKTQPDQSTARGGQPGLGALMREQPRSEGSLLGAGCREGCAGR